MLLDREEEEQGTMHTAAGGRRQAGGLLTDYIAIAGAFNAAVAARCFMMLCTQRPTYIVERWVV